MSWPRPESLGARVVTPEVEVRHPSYRIMPPSDCVLLSFTIGAIPELCTHPVRCARGRRRGDVLFPQASLMTFPSVRTSIPRKRGRMLRRAAAGALLMVALSLGLSATAADAASDPAPPATPRAPAPKAGWQWPLLGSRVVLVHFRAPEHAWSPGHRGADLAAAPGAEVRAPADGTIAFRGVVVDRPLLTITHTGDLVTTLEPVDSPLRAGDTVRAGEVVGSLARGGHAPAGALHLGLRWHGEYINPLMMYGDLPRAVLLPCCAPLP